VAELGEIFKNDLFKNPKYKQPSDEGEQSQEARRKWNPSDEDGNPKYVKLNIFSQSLPVPEPITPPEGDVDPEIIEEGLAASEIENQAAPFPYAIVRLTDGKIEQIDQNQTVTVLVIFGVYDMAYDSQGHKDILHMIQKVEERFGKNALLAGKYECVMPINWALQDEDSYPFYVGGLTLNFETLGIRREDDLIV
jgi:hypothetical protein